MEEVRKFRGIYILPALYVIVAYGFGLLAYRLPGMELEKHMGEQLATAVWILPLTMGVINLIVVLGFGKRISREQLLHCTLLIKYALIPLYLVGGLGVVLFFALAFVPLPFMIMIGPVLAIGLCVLGWMILVGAAPFSIAYLVRARQEGVHGTFSVILAGIFQFFFALDVISMMVLAVKEKKWVKVTMVVILLTILLALLGIVGEIILWWTHIR